MPTILLPPPPEPEKFTDPMLALRRIGQLCKWVGWVEQAHPSGGRDMREILRIVEQVTGLAFDEYN